jgi:hypothetical protein
MTTKPTLAEDVMIAISCMQDYRDKLKSGSELWNITNETIERLFNFYYQLTGFDPNNIRTIKLDQID